MPPGDKSLSKPMMISLLTYVCVPRPQLVKLEKHVWHLFWWSFPLYWPFVRGIHRSLANSPHKGQWCGALMFSLICAWTFRLSKQSRRRWFEVPSRSLRRHYKAWLALRSVLFQQKPCKKVAVRLCSPLVSKRCVKALIYYETWNPPVCF